MRPTICYQPSDKYFQKKRMERPIGHQIFRSSRFVWNYVIRQEKRTSHDKNATGDFSEVHVFQLW